MAYLQELRMECNARGCRRETVVEAYDNRNKPAGKFCRKHGRKQLERLQKELN